LRASDRDAVAALEQAIVQRIGQARFDLWFGNNTRLTWDAEQLLVGVPNQFYQDWMQQTFTDDVRAAAELVLGGRRTVQFRIDPELTPRTATNGAVNGPSASLEPQLPRRNDNLALVQRGLFDDDMPPAIRRASVAAQRHWRRLDEFVVGPCNRLAHAAALAVVEGLGHAPNPLVFHGGHGTGKTHLLEGIRLALQHAAPRRRSSLVSAEEFTNRFLQAMQHKKMAAFRRQMRDLDVLLLDDLQFLARKKATQEEFKHTLDALLTDGKQLVVACDCHPRLIDDLSSELSDRLAGGAAWEVFPPDDATRVALVRHLAGRLRLLLSEDVLAYVAEHVRGNVRELEGALHALRHVARVQGRDLDLAITRESLGVHLRAVRRVVRLDDVERAVTRVLCLDDGMLCGDDRCWKASHPRMLAMYLARQYTTASQTEIGRFFGKRNHSTVAAAEKKVKDWLERAAEMTLGGRRLHVRDVVRLIERELAR
jgi:chromosomal replication initiator protein